MNKATWKWLVVIGLTAWSLAIVTPIQKKIKLGIDLKGGSSFTVELDQQALRDEILKEEPEIALDLLDRRVAQQAAEAQENAVEVIRNRVDGLGIAEPNIYSMSANGQYRIIVQLPGIDDAQREAARDSILSVAFLEFRLVHKSNSDWISEVFQKGLAPRGYKISQDGAGYVADYQTVPVEQRGKAFHEAVKKFQYRPGCEFLLEKNEDDMGRITYRPFYVEARHHLTGDSVVNAQVEYHNVTGKPRVSMEFNGEGAKRFAVITRNYAPRGPKNPNSDVGRQLAIVLDGTLYSAPTINEEIPSGRAEISGNFRVPEAMRLANVLRAGALKAPVDIVEVRSVSPSLGADSVRSGLMALALGGAAVLIFMMGYYLLSGIIANIALVLNILLLPLGMVIAAGFLGTLTNASASTSSAVSLPTLTLPGIAGIVLTIGMAVDANVLIFERIREELLAGKQLGNAINAGYEKVFSTIFDANITTLLTAVILFWQGSGPIRGFAVTLSAGIIVSMFTALVVTRMLFDLVSARPGRKTLKMFSLVGSTSIDFLGKRFLAIGLSLILIVGSLVTFFTRGVESNFGVDFTGGASLVFSFEDQVPEDTIRSVLSDAGIAEAVIQYHRELGTDLAEQTTDTLEVKVAYEHTELVKQKITESFEEQGYQFRKEDSVGPQVGHELRRKGIWAIVGAMLGIVLYISIRFEFAFAMGAIVAVLHDVLITVGLFCLFGNQLSLPIVAALLTIVGYSVNDTIVVFDRIREDLKLVKNKSYQDICNLSINQTLSRTLLTSLTTLLSVTMLLVFGGGAIRDFALALFIGVIVGTYSSIFVATPVMLLWHRDEKTA